MEILNKTEIFEQNNIVAIIGLSIVVFILLAVVNIDKFEIAIMFAILSILCSVALEILNQFDLYKNMPTGKYRYEIILKEDYPALEFYEKYKVIEQRGRVWIIEDK